MRYFVVDANGNRYGPVDIATLNAWAREGRVLPTMLIEEEASGIRSVASSVNGLFFPGANAPPPVNYAGYSRPGPGPMGGTAQSDLNAAWTFGIFGLLCCGLLAIPGYLKAKSAQAQGHPGAQGAIILNMIVLVLMALAIVANVVVAASGGWR